MNRYIPGDIYSNIEKLLKYRNINTNYKFLSIDNFAKEINHYGYIIIDGVNNKTNITTYIILFSPGSNYSLKSPDFSSLIKTKLQKNQLENPTDILIISELPLSNHIEKVLSGLREKYPKIFIENHSYNKFIIEIPKHVSVPKHEFATQDEVDNLLKNFYKNKLSFPKILQSDSAVIWLGARVGDIIKITRISETAGTSIAYRIVTR